MPMILAIDTSTAACTAALFGEDGEILDRRDELIGRGHAERLMPMIEELLQGRRPDCILVGVGPGSFTGLRVGIAAAHGMAIGWGARVCGMSSLALLAASIGDGQPVAAAMAGGHGELFVQQFGEKLEPVSPVLNLPPSAAGQAMTAHRVVGPGAASLVAARGVGEAVDAWPCASSALAIPFALRSLDAAPVYARAPDARAGGAA